MIAEYSYLVILCFMYSIDENYSKTIISTYIYSENTIE